MNVDELVAKSVQADPEKFGDGAILKWLLDNFDKIMPIILTIFGLLNTPTPPAPPAPPAPGPVA